MKKRNVMFATIITSMVLSGFLTVQAASSPKVISPKFILNTYSWGETYNLTSGESHAAPENSYVTFVDCGSLEDSYVNVSERDFPIFLTDDDGAFGDDDLQRYEGYFYGRVLSYVRWEGLVDTSGYIDSTGDKVGELYLQGKLAGLPGDIQQTGGTELFWYTISLD